MDAPTTRKPLLVLADDEAFISLAYTEGFERAGFEVVAADDGAEALAKIKDRQPDIILLDLIMPKMNGFEVLKAVKADDKLKDIPVAVLSNLSQNTDEDEVRSLGAVDFIIKSDFSLEEVIGRVKTILKM